MKTLKYLFLLLLALIFPFSAFAEETQNTPIEGCIDNLATNYDIEATIHVQSMCEYPDIPILQPAIQPVILTHTEEKPKPQNITGYFETSKVNHGATTWTMTLNTSIENAFLDIKKIQTWNKFTPVSFYNQDKKISSQLNNSMINALMLSVPTMNSQFLKTPSQPPIETKTMKR